MGATVDPVDLSRWLPSEVLGFKIQGSVESHDAHNLFELLDGGAEVYLALNVQTVVSCRYGKPGAADIMVDILTCGWSALQTLRNQNYKLVIHAHRAGHGMFTHNPKHGMTMLAVSKIDRLIGSDTLHIGTFGTGKMKSDWREEAHIRDSLVKQKIKELRIGTNKIQTLIF
jgi:hypothetical protein